MLKMKNSSRMREPETATTSSFMAGENSTLCNMQLLQSIAPRKNLGAGQLQTPRQSMQSLGN